MDVPPQPVERAQRVPRHLADAKSDRRSQKPGTELKKNGFDNLYVPSNWTDIFLLKIKIYIYLKQIYIFLQNTLVFFGDFCLEENNK